MAEKQLTQAELAELVNVEIHRLTGKEGRVCDRVVRQWVAARVTWPQERQRRALEAVFERSSVQLGFISRARPGSGSLASHTEEDPMRRRTFITSAAAATATMTTPPVRNRVGSSDIDRLNGRFTELITADQRDGGRPATEHSALAMAKEAVALQERGTISQRIRNRLYGCAAAFTSSAMWAAIDGRRFEAAQQHLDRASSLAAMSGDQAIQFRIWSHAGTLYRHLNRPADALSANNVARRTGITRRDPVFAALGHARQAAILGTTGDAAEVGRTLDLAWQALDRASEDEARPLWLAAVRSGAEIEELALSARLSLGHYEQAEAHAHRSLALLSPFMRRDRTLVAAHLAQAQLGQGDVESAVATAMSIPRAEAVGYPRALLALRSLGADIHRVAPGSRVARSWDAHLHETMRART